MSKFGSNEPGAEGMTMWKKLCAGLGGGALMIGLLGMFVVAPIVFLTGVHHAARLALTGVAEHREIVDYKSSVLVGRGGATRLADVKVQGYEGWIKVGGKYQVGQSAVFVFSEKGQVASVIRKDNWRFFRLLDAESQGQPGAVLLGLFLCLLSLFLIFRCLRLVLLRAIVQAKVGSKKIGRMDLRSRITEYALLTTRVALMLSAGLLVVLVGVVSVKTAIVVEQHALVPGVIYYGAMVLIGSPLIPALSKWMAQFVAGRVHRKLREFLVSIISLLAAIGFGKALLKLIWADTSQWNAWRDVLMAFWNALLA